MTNIKNMFIGAILIFLPTISFADNNRYAAISHIDSNFASQGFCAYLFKADNGTGAMGSSFNELELSLRANDVFGQPISSHLLKIEAFGDSNSTRTTFSLLETECIEGLHEFEITNVREKQNNGKQLELPLYLFSAHNPKLARMKIQSEPGADIIHRNFIGTWVTDPVLCAHPQIEDDSQFILKIAGDTVRLNGWMMTYTESFPNLKLADNEDMNTPEAFGGMANFFQFSPDYSQSSGTRESFYRIIDNKLMMGEAGLEFISCNPHVQKRDLRQ